METGGVFWWSSFYEWIYCTQMMCGGVHGNRWSLLVVKFLWDLLHASDVRGRAWKQVESSGSQVFMNGSIARK